MGNELRFDGRVAIVTGAGGGLGRAHALLLASRGAKVVVNDLGGTFTGEGASSSMADAVVAEIVEAGGEAVANYDSVVDGEKIVQTAMDTWGRLDILVNNAGILRDVSFPKMTQEDWDKIYQVHVLGAFKVTHAAWPIMREQKYGRVIITSSAAGIYGNFGQVNYATAKLGLVGMGFTLAREGVRKNILVNTIAPIAGSRMTETVIPPALLEALAPEYVAPLVAYLCHESCEETGGLFEVGGGFFAKLRWERTEGRTYRMGRQMTVEDIDQSWEQITDFGSSTHPEAVMESMQPIMENVEAGPSKGGNKFIDVDEALGWTYPKVETSYDERDLALYAMGVGAAKTGTDETDLPLVYEMAGGGMKALPTFAVIPALNALMGQVKEGVMPAGLNYGLEQLLHGEQYTELKRPLPTKGKLTHRSRVKDIFDKGKHALVVTEVVTSDEDGVLAVNDLTSLIRGAGGWGGDRGPSAPINEPPERAPDAVAEELIPDNQALLYRLSGDWNPLHADPGFAKAMGFDKPILHGLCTFGYAGRHVVQRFAPGGNPDYFKSIQVRFADHVYPGETLVTEMWKESDTRIIFRCLAKERESVVISNAAIELYTEIPKPEPKPKAEEKAAAVSREPVSADLFNAIGGFVAADEGIGDRVKTVFLFELSDPVSAWTLDLSAGAGSVKAGAHGKAGCTLMMSDADFLAMATGKADAMKLFSTGKLKITGDVMASQKLNFLNKITPESVMAEVDKRLGAGGGEAAPAAEEAEPTSWDVFIAIRDYVARNPEMIATVGKTFLFRLTDPDSEWTLDLKNGAGAVEEGETLKADCTLMITESDFLDMSSGKADPMKLFSTGKLKITGDVMASQKLNFLQKIDPEQAKEAVAKARAEGGPGAAAETTATAEKVANAPAIFEALHVRLAAKPVLKDEVQAKVQFRVTEPDAAWHVDLAGAMPVVVEGEAEADATLTISDESLAALVRGEQAASALFQKGELQVEGDFTVAHRLGFLNGLI
jgi:3-hydroxyacyl-CoA dehydrogenase/3a,7a,12a-trihydroxy-5b-cholest-24-enoyl-CoA hydratase